jgi:replicative DNA helicase
MTSSNATPSTLIKLKIEQIVLGAILLDEVNYWHVADVLSMDLFGSESHQKIFAIIHELASDNRAIRVPIVAGRLGDLEGQDPDAYTSMLLHVASKEESIPLRDYAFELRDAATRRKVMALAEGMMRSAGDVKYDAQSIVDRAAERLADISRSATIEHETTMSAVFARAAQDMSSQKTGAVLRPCLIGLEEMVGSFRPGSLVLWGGAPGSGKTAIAMQQMLYSSTVHPTTLFELEMDPESLAIRSTAGQTGVSIRQLANGMSEAQYEALLKASKDFQNRKLTFVAPAKMTIQQIRSRAYAHKRKFGLHLLGVDHLKLVERVTKARMDPVERAYENARDLKALAKDLNCVVVALCQFTKAARQKEQPEPEMEDFYGGSLEEHADVMLANFNRNDWHNRNPPAVKQGKAYEDWLSRKNATANKIEVYKLKDRFGAPRDVRIFDWDAPNTLFRDQQSQVSLFDEHAA